MADAALKNRIVGHGEEAPEQLLANPRNWRIHPHLQEEALEGALAQVGWVQTVLVNRTTGHLIDGHLRVALAIRLGEPSLPVTYVELTEEEESLVLASLDPLAGMAAVDEEAFAALLGEITVDSAALAEALSGVSGNGKRSIEGEDEIPEPPAEPTTKPGDLWMLGEHRVLCGDATLDAAWSCLGVSEAGLAWTDPPYGVSYIGKTADALTIANDQEEGIRSLLEAVLPHLSTALADGSPVYLMRPPGALGLIFLEEFSRHFRLHQELVWVKDALVLGHADYHYRHEPILYGYKAGQGRRGRGGAGWYGGNAEDSVFEVPRPKASRDHPIVKPVELVSRCIENSSPPRSMVLDPFLGSGTTLIACEETGRTLMGMEIDPVYCDVTVQRWENLTGEKAELAERPDTGQGGTRHGQPRAAAERAGTRSRAPRP